MCRPERFGFTFALLLSAAASAVPGVWEWAPQAVRAPVSAEGVSNGSPWVEASVPEVQGEVEVGPSKGAAVWVGPLELLRVSSSGNGLRFQRVLRALAPDEPKVMIDEPGTLASEGHWYLAEPPGPGSVW